MNRPRLQMPVLRVPSLQRCVEQALADCHGLPARLTLCMSRATWLAMATTTCIAPESAVVAADVGRFVAEVAIDAPTNEDGNDNDADRVVEVILSCTVVITDDSVKGVQVMSAEGTQA
jgi:hypothetical protein